jgi:hypothetical protein
MRVEGYFWILGLRIAYSLSEHILLIIIEEKQLGALQSSP